MKKWWLWFLPLPVIILAGLWYLGGLIPETGNSAAVRVGDSSTFLPQPALKPLVDADKSGGADWKEELEQEAASSSADTRAVTLVVNALEKKVAPLLPPELSATPAYKPYRLSDLKLIETEDVATIDDYGRQVAKIMSVFNNPGLGNEIGLTIAMAEGEREVTSTLPDLNLALLRYHQSITDLLTVTAPKSASQIHLNLINALGRLEHNTKLMIKINNEPMVALAAADLQPGRIKNILTDIRNLNLFFTMRGVESIKQEVAIALDI